MPRFSCCPLFASIVLCILESRTKDDSCHTDFDSYHWMRQNFIFHEKLNKNDRTFHEGKHKTWKPFQYFERLFIFLLDSFELCSPSKLNKMNYCDSLEIWSLLKLEIFYFIDYYYYYRFHSQWAWTLLFLPHDRRELSLIFLENKNIFLYFEIDNFSFI